MIREEAKWRHGAKTTRNQTLEDSNFAQPQSRNAIDDSYFVYCSPNLRPIAPYFEIHEHQEDHRLRLQLTGELDLASVPVLENRLEHLRAETRPVCLDLSGLNFMDSTGIHLLLSAFNHAREDGWQFEVDPRVSSQVQYLFELTDMKPVAAGSVNGQANHALARGVWRRPVSLTIEKAR